MSNDSKFWASRGAVGLCLVGIVFILGKVIEQGIAYDPANPNSLKLWFVLLLVAVAASLPVGVVHYRNKQRRWEQSQADADKLAIETLAALGAQRRQDAPRPDKPSEKQ